MRIAIVGAGIAGLGTAHRLANAHEVHVFEKNHYLGGHSHTVEVTSAHGTQPVDTGFIVYNERNYPRLTALFAELGVPTRGSDMSFGASIGDGRIEYAGDNLMTLFGQPGNLLRWRHYRMLRDIVRFNRDAKALLAAESGTRMTLGEFLARGGYGPELSARYLMPMAAAIWSCPTDAMRAFPMLSFARFFANHGLLDVRNRPQWRTVVGGSREYVRRLVRPFAARVHTDTAVTAANRSEDGVRLCFDAAGEARFDQVVFACHADQTLAMLTDADAGERRVLSAFAYQPNRAVLHTDPALMPRRRRVWSSWNYLGDDESPERRRVSVTYWMNRLQCIDGPRQYFVSLNPLREPRAEMVVRELDYRHPVFDRGAIAAQAALPDIQGRRRSWFCGAWSGYGFHEDGLASGQGVAEALAATPAERAYVPA